jgi:hypothetical protein
MKKTIVAAISIAALLFTPSGASAQVCIVGIFAAAIHANMRDNRELTEKEALSCGILYLTEGEKPKKEIVRRTKRTERTDRK